MLPCERSHASQLNFLLHAGLAGLVNAALIGIVLLCLTPVFRHMPLNALAAIVITGVIGLLDFPRVIFLLKVSSPWPGHFALAHSQSKREANCNCWYGCPCLHTPVNVCARLPCSKATKLQTTCSMCALQPVAHGAACCAWLHPCTTRCLLTSHGCAGGEIR